MYIPPLSCSHAHQNSPYLPMSAYVSHTITIWLCLCVSTLHSTKPHAHVSLYPPHTETQRISYHCLSLYTYHTCTLPLSRTTLNKGFPVNNLPSIHQQSWQYGKHETWKRINLHVLRPPSMTTRTRASQKARRRHPLLVGDGKIFVLHSREVIVLRPHVPRRWIECRC